MTYPTSWECKEVGEPWCYREGFWTKEQIVETGRIELKNRCHVVMSRVNLSKAKTKRRKKSTKDIWFSGLVQILRIIKIGCEQSQVSDDRMSSKSMVGHSFLPVCTGLDMYKFCVWEDVKFFPIPAINIEWRSLLYKLKVDWAWSRTLEGTSSQFFRLFPKSKFNLPVLCTCVVSFC